MSKKKVIIISVAMVAVIGIISLLGVFIWYETGKKPVQGENGQVVRLEIEEKSGII